MLARINKIREMALNVNVTITSVEANLLSPYFCFTSLKLKNAIIFPIKNITSKESTPNIFKSTSHLFKKLSQL